MLKAHPAVLRELVERYDALASDGRATPQLRQEFDDVCYTLCVTTGTRSVEHALELAREQIAEPETRKR